MSFPIEATTKRLQIQTRDGILPAPADYEAMSELRVHIQSLHLELAAYTSCLDSYICHTAPIRFLPNEILEAIFLFCYLNSVIHKRTLSQPVNLSHVCKRWRSVATGCPRLWNQIVIGGPGPYRGQEEITAHLRNSRELPLSLGLLRRVVLNGSHNRDVHFLRVKAAEHVVNSPNKDLLLHSAYRWKEVHAEIAVFSRDVQMIDRSNGQPIRPLLKSPGTLPRLTWLSLIGLDFHLTRPVTFFEGAFNLRTLCLQGEASHTLSDIPELMINSASLRRLILRTIPVQRPHVRTLLQGMTTLTRLRIDCPISVEPVLPFGNAIFLPDTLEVFVLVLDLHSTWFLQWVRAPSTLRTLVLASPVHMPPWELLSTHELKDILTVAHGDKIVALTRLHFINVQVDLDTFIELAGDMPSLVYLEVWCSQDLSYEQICNILTHCGGLPLLQKLLITSCQSCDMDPADDIGPMIEARKPGSGGQLRFVGMTWKDGFTCQTAERNHPVVLCCNGQFSDEQEAYRLSEFMSSNDIRADGLCPWSAHDECGNLLREPDD